MQCSAGTDPGLVQLANAQLTADSCDAAWTIMTGDVIIWLHRQHSIIESIVRSDGLGWESKLGRTVTRTPDHLILMACRFGETPLTLSWPVRF